MKEQFCSYEIALKLKELGFNEPCIAYYFNRYGEVELFSEFVLDHSKTVFYQCSEYEIIAPLWQQVIDWFREKYNMEIMLKSWEQGNKLTFLYSVHKIGSTSSYRIENNIYEEAREQAILKAIELCQKEK